MSDLRVAPLTPAELAELRLFCERNNYGIPFQTFTEGSVFIRRLLATIDAATATLDAAWAEVEALLPEGWWLELRMVRGGYLAFAHRPSAGSGRQATADTPAAALRALAARLHERTEP